MRVFEFSELIPLCLTSWGLGVAPFDIFICDGFDRLTI